MTKKTPYVHQVKGRGLGRVKLRSKPLTKPAKYRVRARKAPTSAQAGGAAKSEKFGLKYPDLDPGDRGPAVKLFNDLLRDEHYYDTDGHEYGSHTERAVMAFRKVNGMARNFQATPGDLPDARRRQGRVPDRPPGRRQARRGRHLQAGTWPETGTAKYVFHISTGAAATPSDQGGFTFYSKDPGYNSLGMYYSVYYNRGEATHGYHSVPPYPASHGCIRNPIPDSIFIYNWIDLGDKMFVYVSSRGASTGGVVQDRRHDPVPGPPGVLVADAVQDQKRGSGDLARERLAVAEREHGIVGAVDDERRRR